MYVRSQGGDSLVIYDICLLPSPTLTPTQTQTSTSTNAPANSPPNPNCLSGFIYCVTAGPSFKSNNGLSIISGSNDASSAQVILSSNSSVNDLYLTVNKQTPNDLLTSNVKFPWEEGLNTAGEIYNFQSVSAFNGYPIHQLNNPVTIIVPYDPVRL